MLRGLRVLDLSQGVAGPYCGAIFQQQGAEVVKLEPPGGDWARNMGEVHDGFSAVALAYNAGKRGLCLDAGSPAGRDAIRRVAAGVDIVIQNFRHGVVDRMGIGYDAIAALNPRVIYVSISGFGSTGPLADQPATDNVLQALSGMMSINRDAAGQPKRNGLLLADLATALYASQLACAALFRRAIDGGGRHIELSLLEACAAIQSSNIADAVFSAGRPPAKAPSAPAGIFEVVDGHLTVGTLNNAMFQRLCGVLDVPEWATHPDYATNPLRLAHAEVLNLAVAERLKVQPLAHWLPRMKAADVLHAPIQDYLQFLVHEQVVRAGLFGQVSTAGQVPVPRARHPGTPLPTGGVESAPAVGEHTLAVLRDFDFTPEEIEDLIAARVAVQRHPVG